MSLLAALRGVKVSTDSGFEGLQIGSKPGNPHVERGIHDFRVASADGALVCELCHTGGMHSEKIAHQHECGARHTENFFRYQSVRSTLLEGTSSGPWRELTSLIEAQDGAAKQARALMADACYGAAPEKRGALDQAIISLTLQAAEVPRLRLHPKP